jgi:hypothetical protein
VAASVVGSRGACTAKRIGIMAGMAIRKARNFSIGRDSADGNFPCLRTCDGGGGHHEFLRLVVVNNVRIDVIHRDRRFAAGRLLHQVDANVRSGNRQSVSHETALKLSRRFIENFYLLRGVHGGALERLAGLGWRKDDPMFEVERRLPFHIIWMPWYEADFAPGTHPKGMRRMYHFACLTHASRRNPGREHSCVVAVVLNPSAVPAGI